MATTVRKRRGMKKTMEIDVPSPMMTAMMSAMSEVSTVPVIMARPPKGPSGESQPLPVSRVKPWCTHVGNELQKIVPTKPTLTAAKSSAATNKSQWYQEREVVAGLLPATTSSYSSRPGLGIWSTLNVPISSFSYLLSTVTTTG